MRFFLTAATALRDVLLDLKRLLHEMSELCSIGLDFLS